MLTAKLAPPVAGVLDVADEAARGGVEAIRVAVHKREMHTYESTCIVPTRRKPLRTHVDGGLACKVEAYIPTVDEHFKVNHVRALPILEWGSGRELLIDGWSGGHSALHVKFADSVRLDCRGEVCAPGGRRLRRQLGERSLYICARLQAVLLIAIQFACHSGRTTTPRVVNSLPA